MASGATRRCLQELAAVARSARGVQGVTTVEPAEAAAVAERDQPQILPADHDAVVLAHLEPFRDCVSFNGTWVVAPIAYAAG